MLKWLRSSGDALRLDQELERIGTRPSALPPKMREQLVQVIQNHVDLARDRGGLTTSEFQVFFDTAFEMGAAVPTVVGAPKKLAIEAVGEPSYDLVVHLISDDTSSMHGNLAKALYATCRSWIQQQNPDFEAAVRQVARREG